MRRSNLLGWLFVGPAFAHLVIFALFPMAYALFLSFYKWHLLKNVQHFVGLSNYSFCLTDDTFKHSLWNSARYALVAVPFGMAIALLVAILVNQKLRGITIFRTLYYIPAISSGVAIAMLWIYVYLPDSGLINTMLLRLAGQGTWLGTEMEAHLGVHPFRSIDFLN